MLKWRFILLFLFSRLSLLLGLGLALEGAEFTDDARNHLWMAVHPLEQLAGLSLRNAQHPPLLGLLQALSVGPFRALVPDFYALRLSFILWELLGFMIFCSLLECLPARQLEQKWLLPAMLWLPMGWMCSTVMAQDEVITCTWMLLVLWCAARGWTRTALLLSGLGVVAVKVFLVLPLFVLAFSLPGSTPIFSGITLVGPGDTLPRAASEHAQGWRSGLRRRLPGLLLGLLPIVLVTPLREWLRPAGTVAGLPHFVPPNVAGVNLWVPLTAAGWLSVEQALWTSLLLCLVALLLCLVALLLCLVALLGRQGGLDGRQGGLDGRQGGLDGHRGGLIERAWRASGCTSAPDAPAPELDRLRVIGWLGALFAWILVLFYHVNPEYYWMAFPLWLLWARGISSRSLLVVLAALPWVVNGLYGLERISSAEGAAGALRRGVLAGKRHWLDLYHALLPFSPSSLAPLSLWVSSLLTIVLAILLTRSLGLKHVRAG